MEVALTGSSGFLGNHIKEYFQTNGHTVIPIPHDLLNDVGALKYKLRNGFDYLIHAAAYGNYYDQNDDFQTVESNITYTHNLLQATKDIAYKGFINVSTSSVYGIKIKPMDEQDKIDPETLYGATKAAAEHIVSAFSKTYNKPCFSVRPFTMYGPGDNDKHLIPTVIRKIKAQEELMLDPKPTHDYIYVVDAVRAIDILKDQGIENPGTVINIGSGFQYENGEIVGLIQDIMNKKAILELTKGLRHYDSRYWVADTTLLRFLGFTPDFDITRGLAETIYAKQRN